MYESELSEELEDEDDEEAAGQVMTCPMRRDAKGAMEWTKYVWFAGIWSVGSGPFSAMDVKFIATMTDDENGISLATSSSSERAKVCDKRLTGRDDRVVRRVDEDALVEREGDGAVVERCVRGRVVDGDGRLREARDEL